MTDYSRTRDGIPSSDTPSQQIKKLEKRIAELENRWPAHSVPPTLMQQLDDLEDELASIKRDL